MPQIGSKIAKNGVKIENPTPWPSLNLKDPY